jgi:hypothetical protein
MMHAARIGLLFMLPAMLVGCGEYKQAVEYRDGGYQGKQDERPWDSERFMHDPSAWRQVLHERNQRQNEYGRTGD